MARAWNQGVEPLPGRLLQIQNELVTLMGELACAAEDRERYAQKGFHFVEERHVTVLTEWIDDLERNHKISYQHWATPGTTQGSAMLDHARAVCRRAERMVWTLRESGLAVEEVIARYLNRLSDLCWLWARWVETLSGAAV